MKTDRRTFETAGAWLWISCAQFYLAQMVVAARWPDAARYRYSENAISDLGNTVCGPFQGREVCSPLFGAMNASFVLLGVAMLAGAWLVRGRFRPGRAITVGFALFGIAGVGVVLVGLAPENVASGWHGTGAGFSFVFGNLAMIVLGIAFVEAPRRMRGFTLLSGGVGIVGLGLFLSRSYFGLGYGGMERVVAYPQSIWAIVFGVFLLTKGRSSPSLT